jgi:hypothetical protein
MTLLEMSIPVEAVEVEVEVVDRRLLLNPW